MSNQMIKEIVRSVKRSDYHKDEEHPYGNKLDKRFVTMRGLKGFRTGGAIGATLSPALGAAGHQFFGLPGAIIGAAIPAAAGGMYGAKINKEIAQEERALSHLPIKEQKALKNDIKKALGEMRRLEKIDAEQINEHTPDNVYDKFSKDYNLAQSALRSAYEAERKAIKRGMEIMNKKASIDYEEMVKLAYEDIMADF